MFIEPSADAKRRPFLAELLDRFMGAVARWNETQRLDFSEMEAIAHELNLSKAELKALTFRPSGGVHSLRKRLSAGPN